MDGAPLAVEEARTVVPARGRGSKQMAHRGFCGVQQKTELGVARPQVRGTLMSLLTAWSLGTLGTTALAAIGWAGSAAWKFRRSSKQMPNR